VPGTDRSSWRGLPGLEVAEVCGAFLPERLHRRAEREDAPGGGHAEGDPWFRGPGIRQEESRGSCGKAEGDEVGQSGGDRSQRCRGNLQLLRFSPGALAVVEDEQPVGADQPGNPEKDPGGGKLPGWAIGPDAGGGKVAAHRLHEVGNPGLHGHGTPLRHGEGPGGEGPGVAHERLAQEDWTALLEGLSA